MEKIIYKVLFALAAVIPFTAAGNGYELKPRLNLTDAQVERARRQLADDPQLAMSVDNFKKSIDKNIRDWKRIVPARDSRYSMDELFALAKGATHRPQFMTEAAAMLLYPSDAVAETLREKLLFEIGIHKNEGSWRELGIHQGERLARFLQAYDIVAASTLFTGEEKQVIIDELHQAARFLEAWTLESDINEIYQGQTYCFNIKYYPICMLGTVGMYFPQFEESAVWVAKANDEVLRLLLTENFMDGAYGENSIHYWAPTMNGLLVYINASRNLGYRDYMEDATFRNYLQKFVKWRADLTGTDGRKVAIGDAHRCGVGAEELLEAAYLLGDHETAWIVKSIHDRVNGGYLLSPHQMLTFDSQFELRKPAYNYANYIWSGYGIYRSGWEADDNFLMMKYGPTWAGRRELEKLPVIAGHSHQDCMGIEMLYKGIPMFVDGGYRGVYRDYDTYGGFWKATIAHNTVGLGNEYGYSRTDGRFDEHVRNHGKEFRYEKEQINTYRNSSRLTAFSDVGSAVLLAAKATTYENVEHERSIVWLRGNSLTIVHDKLTSDRPQNFEFYLNPVGKLLSDGDTYTFGDDIAKLDVSIVGEKGNVDVVGKGTKGIPAYYYPFRAGFRGEPQWDGPNARWADYMLMVQGKKSENATFFNVLVPYQGENPYTSDNFGSNGRVLTNGTEKLFVSEGASGRQEMEVDGRFGVLRTVGGRPEEYVLSNGYELSGDGKVMVKSELNSTAWSDLYDHKVTAMVGLDAKRATFVLEPDPWNEYVLLYNPKIEEGKEAPVPIRVAVSFYTGTKPVRMVRQRSNGSVPELDDPVFDAKIEKGNFGTGLKNYGTIESRLARTVQEFDYDAKTGMVTVVLPHGFNHLVWE